MSAFLTQSRHCTNLDAFIGINDEHIFALVETINGAHTSTHFANSAHDAPPVIKVLHGVQTKLTTQDCRS
jgi:hypothetical protein